MTILNLEMLKLNVFINIYHVHLHRNTLAFKKYVFTDGRITGVIVTMS